MELQRYGTAAVGKGIEPMMEVEKRMLYLEKVLSTLSGHEGWVIGKCQFESGTPEEAEASDPPCTMKVLRENRNLAEVRIEGRKGMSLEVMLMRPMERRAEKADERNSAEESLKDTEKTTPEEKDLKNSGIQDPAENGQKIPDRKMKTAGNTRSENPAATLWQRQEFLVSRAETDRYLALSNDKNPIHRGSGAIVPGFLMVNRIASLFERTEKLQTRFLSPLPVGEKAELTVQKKSEKEYLAEIQKAGKIILKMKIWEAEQK